MANALYEAFGGQKRRKASDGGFAGMIGQIMQFQKTFRGDDALMHGHAGGYDVRGRRVRERDRVEREHPSGSREHMIRRMMEMLSAEGDEKQKEMLHKWIEQLENE